MLAVLDDHGAGLVDAARGVDDAGLLEDDRHAAPPTVAARFEQRFHHRHADRHAHLDLFLDDALRTVGDSEAISTPRFIGPGCITSASSLASFSLAASSP
jgi:hypothetical protein